MSFSVLLVDDDPNTQALFQDALEHYGIDLLIADSEQTALNSLRHYTPDIIVLDIFLPDTDGYKLLQMLRSMDTVHCPIVATTGYYTTDTMDNLQKRGFDGYLLKPLDPQELVSYLQNIVG